MVCFMLYSLLVYVAAIVWKSCFQFGQNFVYFDDIVLDHFVIILRQWTSTGLFPFGCFFSPNGLDMFPFVFSIFLGMFHENITLCFQYKIE